MDLRYMEGDSRLHRMHPVVKGSLLILLAAASLIYGAAVNLALVFLILALSLASGIRPGRIVTIIKPVPVFVLIIIAANIFLVRNGQPYTVDLVRGVIQGVRVFVLILSAGLFLAVTDPARFSDSVLFLGSPLKAFGIKKEDISLILMLVFSFIPHTSQEVERIRRARTVRCGRGGFLSFTKGGVLPLIVPLLASVFRRGEELEMALTARYYHPGGRVRGEGIPFSDILIGTVCFLTFLLGLYAKY